MAKHSLHEALKRTPSMTNPPEHAIPRFVDFPCSHKGYITSECMFQHTPTSSKFASFFPEAGNGDTLGHSTWIVANGNQPVFDGGIGASGCEESGKAGCMRAQSFGKSALWDEF